MKLFNLSLLLVVAGASTAAADKDPPSAPHIFQGDEAFRGEFPYYTQLDSCGAQLIAPRVVLTAAHCDSPGNRDVVNVGAYEYGETESPVQTRRCLAWVNHPEWSGDIGNGHDYALCYLNKPVQSYPNVTLVLNEDPDYPDLNAGIKATAAGMGYRNYFYAFPDILQKAELEVTPISTCDSGLDDDTILCTDEQGTGVCGGDSGGPLVTIEDNGDGTETHTLIGVTSFTYIALFLQCLSSPSGFAKVSGGMDWIKETVCGNNVEASFCDGYVSP